MSFDAHVPLLLRALENALRAGYSLPQALGLAARELPEPAAADVRQVFEAMQGGTPLPAALQGWIERTPSADLNLLIGAIRLQLEAGGNLADKLSLLGQVLERRSPLPAAS